jgi:hypothetical protein
METYVLFALLLVGPVETVPQHGREVTWSAEFTSLDRCNDAGSQLAKKFSTSWGQKFVVVVDYVCVKK